MLDRIKAIFRDNAESVRDLPDNTFDDLQLAIATLLVAAAHKNGNYHEQQHATIARHLAECFEMESDEVERLMALAEIEAKHSNEIYGFTRTVKDAWDHEERVEFMQMLWEVVYSDGELHDYEASLMRLVTGLLYVPDQESGMARKRALQRLGLSG